VGQPGEQQLVELVEHASLVQSRSRRQQVIPTLAKLLGQVLPGDAGGQHVQNALQAGAVVQVFAARMAVAAWRLGSSGPITSHSWSSTLGVAIGALWSRHNVRVGLITATKPNHLTVLVAISVHRLVNDRAPVVRSGRLDDRSRTASMTLTVVC